MVGEKGFRVGIVRGVHQHVVAYQVDDFLKMLQEMPWVTVRRISVPSALKRRLSSRSAARVIVGILICHARINSASTIESAPSLTVVSDFRSL